MFHHAWQPQALLAVNCQLNLTVITAISAGAKLAAIKAAQFNTWGLDGAVSVFHIALTLKTLASMQKIET